MEFGTNDPLIQPACADRQSITPLNFLLFFSNQNELDFSTEDGEIFVRRNY